MTVALDSSASLTMLCDRFKIPTKDREVLAETYGIQSVQQLLENRNKMLDFGSGSMCYERSRRYLVYSIYFLMGGGQEEQLLRFEGLTSKSQTMDPVWRDLILWGLHSKHNKDSSQQGQPLEKKPRATSSTITVKVAGPCRVSPSSAESIFDSEHWDDGNMHSLRHKLGIDREGSPWELDVARWAIVDAENPNMIRIPVQLFGGLYPYQKVGVNWLVNLYKNGTGGILGDGMGMGKTRQTLSFLLSMMYAGNLRNAVVVCPKSVLETTWEKEAKKLLQSFGRAHSIRLEVVSSNQKLRARSGLLRVARKSPHGNPTLVLTTYPTIQNKDLLSSFKPSRKSDDYFEYVVLDEGHTVKNKSTQLSKNIHKICKKSTVLALTGTPLMNRSKELYNLLDLVIGTAVIGKWEKFRDCYVQPIEAARQKDATDYSLERGSKARQKLQDLIRPFLLKRSQNDYLGAMLPPSHEFDIWTKLSSEQRKLYKEYLQSDTSTVQRAMGGDQKCALPLIQKLRKLTMHPLLLHEDYMDKLKSISADRVIQMSPKLAVAMDLVRKWCDKGLRVLLFSDSTKNLDIIEHVMSVVTRSRAIASSEEDEKDCVDLKVCRIDGSTSGTRRKRLVEEFESKESMFNVMLVSTKAGGVGLTLVGACRTIIYNPPWSQADCDQAVARTRRPGQERECVSVHLVAAGTVEEKMYGKQIYKGCLERTVLGNIDGTGPTTASLARHYNKEELSELFTLGPDGICETLQRLNPSDKEQSSWRKKCDVKKDCAAISGLSRRNDIFNTGSAKKRKVDDASLEPQDAVVDTKSGTGCSKTTEVVVGRNTVVRSES